MGKQFAPSPKGWDNLDDPKFGGRMKIPRFAAPLCLVCLGMAMLGGCHGGSGNPLTIEIIPPTTGLSVDVGSTQPITFTAALAQDMKNQGVKWTLSGTTCSGSGCGTLANPAPFSVSYAAPPAPLPSSVALSVTLTATSVAAPSVTTTDTITVEPAPTFLTTNCTPVGVTTPCGLPGGANGVAYNQTIQISGGVAPFTFSVTSGSLPACFNLSAMQTTSSSTSIGGKPCGSGTSRFSIQVTDAGGATPVLQAYTLSVSPPPRLSILFTPLPTALLNAAYSQTLSAQGGVQPLTWSVAGGNIPPGFSLDPAKGIVSGIPSPADIGTYNFTVQVADSALPTPQTYQQPFSILVQAPPPLSILTPAGLLSPGIVATSYSTYLQATGGAPPYVWTLLQGQPPSGLALSTFYTGTGNNGAGNISGTPLAATPTGIPATFTVQVSDSEIPPVSKTAAYGIAVSAPVNGTPLNTLLPSGTYAFLFRGFDKDGAVAIAGSLTTDGNGNITSGTEEINRHSGVLGGSSLTGTYTIDASGDGRGTMQLTATLGQNAVTSDYQLVLEPDGTARFFQDHPSPPPANPDTYATHGEGILKPVVNASYGTGSFSGNYAFSFTGVDLSTPAKPVAFAGVIHADGVGTLLPGTCDFNDAGISGTQGLSGDFVHTAGNVGVAEFNFEAPNKTQATLQFVYVFVSPGDLFFVESDNLNNVPTNYRLSGEMLLQQPNVSFGRNSLSGATVASGTGTDSAGNARVFAGQLPPAVCDASAQTTLAYDLNDAGTVSSLSLPETCSISLYGRVAFNWIQPAPPAPSVSPVFTAAYLVAPGQGFLIGSDATVSTGLLEPQAAGPGFSDASLEGQYALAAPFTAEPGVNNLLGQLFADGSGNLSGTVDEVDSPGTTAHLAQSLTATLAPGGLAANGRGAMTTTGTVPAGFPTNWIFYVVSSGSIRAIPSDSANQHPEVIFLGP